MSLLYLTNIQVQRFWFEFRGNKHFRPLTCKNNSLENTAQFSLIIITTTPHNTLIPYFLCMICLGESSENGRRAMSKWLRWTLSILIIIPISGNRGRPEGKFSSANTGFGRRKVGMDDLTSRSWSKDETICLIHFSVKKKKKYSSFFKKYKIQWRKLDSKIVSLVIYR